jgi:hypothetical protein
MYISGRTDLCEGEWLGLEILKKEAYVVALAPVVMFLGVFAYELGRYRYLKIPAPFIDLSINRLLAGGVVTGILAGALVSVTVWAWRISKGPNKLPSFGAALIVTVILFALPLLFWSTELPWQDLPKWPEREAAPAWIQAVATVLIAVATQVVSQASAKRERALLDILSKVRVLNALDAKDMKAEIEKTPRSASMWLRGGVVASMLVWTAVIFAGLGFTAERYTKQRMCLNGDLVGDVHGDHIILKAFDRHSGVIAEEVKFVGLENAQLTPCAPILKGEKEGNFSWLFGRSSGS